MVHETGLKLYLRVMLPRYAGAADFEWMNLATIQLKRLVDDTGLFCDADKICDEHYGRSAGNILAVRGIAPYSLTQNGFGIANIV